MRSLIPLAAAGGAGMFFQALPRWVKIPAVVGLVALAAIEITKDGSEAFNAAAIFGGQGEEGAAKMADPLKTEADAAAGKPVSGAARMMAKQVEATGADAQQKQAVADASTESIEEIARKKLSGKKLTSTEALRLEEYKKLRGEAEVQDAQSTAARAQALAEKQSAEMASRVIDSMNNGTIIDTMLDLSGIRTVMPEIERLNARRR